MSLYDWSAPDTFARMKALCAEPVLVGQPGEEKQWRVLQPTLKQPADTARLKLESKAERKARLAKAKRAKEPAAKVIGHRFR